MDASAIKCSCLALAIFPCGTILLWILVHAGLNIQFIIRLREFE
jgi:hypothetical protein